MTTEEKLLKKILQEQDKWKDIAQAGSDQPNFKDLSNALDEYYLFNKLKVYCAYLSYTQYIQPHQLDCQKSDVQISSIPFAKKKEINPAIQIYIHIKFLFENMHLENESMEEKYQVILEMIYKHKKRLGKKETLDIYSFLTNYCIRKINTGIASYRGKLFLLQNEIINLKYFNPIKKQTPLPVILYKNMVTTAILLKDNPLFKTIETRGLPQKVSKGFSNGLEWAERFADIYQSKLGKKSRKIYHSYCCALLSFFRRDFIAAYQHLGNPKYVHGILFNLELKVLHLKIIYEVNRLDLELLEKDKVNILKALEALRGAIKYESTKRKQLAYQVDFFQVFYESYKNLFSFFNKFHGKLYNSKDRNYKKEKVVLLEKITNIKYPYQSWFVEKIQEI